MKNMSWLLIVVLAVVGMVALSSCADNSGLSGAAITQPTTLPPKPPYTPAAPTSPAAITLPKNAPAPNDPAALQALRDLVAQLNPDVTVKIADIVRASQIQGLTLKDISAELYTAGCLECVDQFAKMDDITHRVMDLGLADLIADGVMRETVQHLAAGQVVPPDAATQWILSMQQVVGDILQQNLTTPVGSRVGVVGGSNAGGAGGRTAPGGANNADVLAAIASLKQMGINLNGGLDGRIATIVQENQKKVMTYNDVVAALNPVCSECVTELGHVRDATQALLDASNLVPIKDARLRGTAEAFVAGQPVSTVDLASWIRGLQKYLSKLKP